MSNAAEKQNKPRSENRPLDLAKCRTLVTTTARHFSGAVGTNTLSEVAFPSKMPAVTDEAEAGEQEVELEKKGSVAQRNLVSTLPGVGLATRIL